MKINLEKSELITVGSVENLHDLALELVYKVAAIPSSYLDLP